MKSASESDPQKFVTVARILGARGNRGEVAAELLTDFPEKLKTQSELFLADGSGRRGDAPVRQLRVLSFWIDRNHRSQCVFHFEGVTSIDAAQKLRGLDVQIPWEQRAVLPSGSYFVTDLIGCSVFELPQNAAAVSSSPCLLAEAPALLGQVRDVYFPGERQPGTPLLAVDARAGELLVPLAEDICTRVDVAARRIEVLLPEGLRETNDE